MVMKQEKRNLPVIDDPNLRKNQTERFIGGVESVGEYFKHIKKYEKINLTFSVVMAALFIGIIVGSFFVVARNGGFDSMYDARQVARRFNCTNGLYEDIVRSYSDAKSFLEIYNGTCVLYHK